LDEKIAKLDGELRRYRDQMKKAKGSAAASIKKRAMMTLKQKRQYEAQRDKMAATGFNIDSTKFAIDMVQDQQVAIQAIKGAASVLKTEQAKIDLDDVEDVFDDMEELMQDMDDIGEVMGRSYGLGEDVNEADLDAELAGLEDEFDSFEMEGEEAAAAAPADYLPSAPSAEPEAGLDLPPAAPVEAADAGAVAAGGGGGGGGGLDEFGLPMAP
jgi:charged multivesicular body protein 5